MFFCDKYVKVNNIEKLFKVFFIMKGFLMVCQCKGDINIPEKAKLYISSNVEYLSGKTKIVVEKMSHLTQNYNGYLEFLIEDFSDFITQLSIDKFTVTEQDEINILALEIDEPFNFNSFSKTRTLKSWIEVCSSTNIIKMINDNNLTIHFQPIVDLKNKEIFGYECLTRGYDDDGKFISPIEIFDFAKRNDMIFKLDNQARKNAIKMSALKNIKSKIFINFIPTSIYDPANCLRETIKIMNEFNLKPEQIIFEVVESEKINNIAHLKRIMDFYRKEGFLTALDDLGSGYSSLNMFVRLNPDFIKIDQDIIRDIHKEKSKQSIFNALVNIAKDTGTKVLAEGIETKEELEFINSFDIDLAQGYYFAKPTAEPVMSLNF